MKKMTTRTHSPTLPVFVPTNGWPTFSMISQAIAVRRQRLALRSLDDNALADIGISKAQAIAESKRSVWDVPANWRR